MLQLLTVSGSLRAGSSNTVLLAAAARLAPPAVETRAFTELGALPAFNPDLEEDPDLLPAPVARWRDAFARADAVLISSPEYAHGIPGALKNALDWLVGSGELAGKRLGLLNASAASRFAHPQLVEVLTIMSFQVIAGATVVIDIPRRGVDAMRLVDDPVLAPRIRAVVAALLPPRPGR